MLPFDEPNNRNNTYCNHTSYNDTDDSQNYRGCDIWGKINGTYNNGVYSGTVNENSTLNNYLNTTYLNSLKDRDYITSYIFYTGTTKNISKISSNPCSYENGNYLSESKVEMWVLDHTNGVDAKKYGTGYSIPQHNTADQSGLGWLSGYYFDHAYAVKPIQHQNRR